MPLSVEELAVFLAEPALAVPEGVESNFDNPPPPLNRNVLAWAVTTLCTVLTSLILFLTQWLQGAYWGTAYAGYSMIYTPGYYVHQWNLHNRDLVRPLYLILIYGCSYSVVLPLLKTAISLDWCRIIVVDNRRRSLFWWGCMFIASIQIIWGIACVILLNLQCVPHRAIWEFYLPSKCYDLNKVMLASACVQVFTDWCTVFLPQRIIWGLASISASLRLSTTVTFAHEDDRMYFIGPLLFWACAEMTCGFFILSVPCLPSVIKESGLLRRIMAVLGINSNVPARPSNNDIVTFGGSGPAPLNTKPQKRHHTYSEIDEEYGSLPMNNMADATSQETLHLQRGERHALGKSHV
ncbi:Uu.00g067540.m01.CDS01 [Anthostomella pinea]|uniref:Uu.00g067540.m01.CDS01 n=1 Tax=Anthostomella pinea TaxID=933095 RepID=A0AAI8VUZ0_9PEZI|nr:Uu.00g067540.m01.CDS01 [Anthostomella pinea]